MNCDTCKENKVADVPYIVHESAMARNERTLKRMIVALAIAVVLLFATNAAWLYVWNQYDYESEVVTVDSEDGGNANYIGNNGDINNGESNSETP